jgi:hypothetical protein
VGFCVVIHGLILGIFFYGMYLGSCFSCGDFGQLVLWGSEFMALGYI